MWQPDQAAEDRLARTLAGAIAGGLLIGAVLESQSKYHHRCTQEVRTPDGSECVGDYEPVPGPDIEHIVLLLGVGAVAFWLGIREPEQ